MYSDRILNSAAMTWNFKLFCNNSHQLGTDVTFKHSYNIPACDVKCDGNCISGLTSGRTKLNYTSSSTWVHFCGLQRASNGIIPWPVGWHPDKPPNAGSNKVPRTKTSPEIRAPSHFTSQAKILHESLKVTSVSNWWQLLQNSHKFSSESSGVITRALYTSPAQISC
jgi:hypothetical protein